MGIGTKAVCHMAFVVKDIEKTVQNWADFLGIEVPRIWNIPDPTGAPTLTNGVLEDYSDCIISVIEFENLKMEFVQPGENPSPWKTYLEEHGEGFQHVSFVVENGEHAKKVIQTKLGVDDWYHVGYYPSSTYAFFDTKAALGTEVNIKSENDNRMIIEELLKGWKA